MKYVLIDGDGIARQWGEATEESFAKMRDERAGWRYVRVGSLPGDFLRVWKLIDGVFHDQGPLIPVTHVSLRQPAYPAIADQLDALWHAMDRGLLPKVPGFYEPIKAVKDAYPKSG